MISKKCKYALRAVLHLAVESSQTNKMGIRVLAEELKIPAPYLGKILQDLVPRNIISSTKGPNGGFYLTEKNEEAPLINIIDAVDGLAFFENCGLGIKECSDMHPCPIHGDFKIVRDHLKTVFTNKTVKDLATEITLHNLILVR